MMMIVNKTRNLPQLTKMAAIVNAEADYAPNDNDDDIVDVLIEDDYGPGVFPLYEGSPCEWDEYGPQVMPQDSMLYNRMKHDGAEVIVDDKYVVISFS
jgi:hypothetical protein